MTTLAVSLPPPAMRSGLKHTFARTARECKDVVFLSLEVGGWVGGEDEWAGGLAPDFWLASMQLGSGLLQKKLARCACARRCLSTGAPARMPPHAQAGSKEGQKLPCLSVRLLLHLPPRAQADSDEGQDLCDVLGVDTLPSLQFWKGGEKVWEHKGVVRLQEDLGEGAGAGAGVGWVGWLGLDQGLDREALW